MVQTLSRQLFKRYATLVLGTVSLLTPSAWARVSSHVAGWSNTFVPGLGSALLGEPFQGLLQAGLETSTFYWGYSASRRSPLSLDGVPSTIPRYNRTKPYAQSDLSRALLADTAQEFGIKYHMVNTFEAYRKAAEMEGSVDGIDLTPTKQLFLAPFSPDVVGSAWVYVPIGLLAGYLAYDYVKTLNAPSARIPVLTPSSNYLYSVVNLGVYPIGSAAPEEMFFRGFLQHEFYGWVSSPFFSIPLSTALFALAHEPGSGRYSAAVSGAYLGLLAHLNGGRLSPGIAVHFWSVALLGIELVLLSHNSQRTLPPSGFSIQVAF